MNIDLNALLVFFEVVNAQSITKAARTLGLPKSTVSRKIQHLESQVGSALLKRRNRRITVTEEGLRLQDHCARIAAEIEDAGLQATQMRTSLKGRLRVSMPIDFGIGWLSRAIASFAEKYPSIDLEIHVNGRWVDVSEESYDVAIHLGRLLNPDIPFRRLSALTRGVYASSEYLARKAQTINLFHEHECVLTEQQLAEGIWTEANKEGQRREGRVLVNNIGVARELVISGIGVGVLPNVMCRNDVKSGRLVRIMLDWQIPALEASATFFAGRYLPRKTKVFLDHVTEFLASDDIKLRDLRDAAASSNEGAGRKKTAVAPPHTIPARRRIQSVAKNP
jgi:LysR family transcriptional regulator for bpeEF and oprC